VSLGCLGECVEPADAVAGGGGQVGADGAEGLGAMHGAHAAGDLDAQLAHPDDLFCFIVVGRNPQVMGEPEIVIGAVAIRGQDGLRGEVPCPLWAGTGLFRAVG
jgi:hypothetical protein